MAILFDLLCAQPGPSGTKYHGGGEYAKTVLAEIIRQNTDRTIIVFYDYNCFIDEWLLALFKSKKITTCDIKKYSDLKKIFDEYDIDVYYSPMSYFIKDNIIPNSVKKIGTIHGLRFLEKTTDEYEFFYGNGLFDSAKRLIKPLFKGVLKKKWWKRYLGYLNELSYVVCVSNHTKYAVKNFYPKLDKEIHVYYTPCKYLDCFDKKSAEVDGRYILLIGGNRWEKNVARAIVALTGLMDKGYLNDYKVVVVGNLSKSIRRKILHKKCFVEYGYVSPQQLENLYMYCDVFMYISLNEGFGMPPLEAMKYGKTCVVSGICSLPEVCGNAAYYVNPYDIFEIQNRILMATERKIPEELVLSHVLKMKRKQENDLFSLGKLILDSSKDKT